MVNPILILLLAVFIPPIGLILSIMALRSDQSENKKVITIVALVISVILTLGILFFVGILFYSYWYLSNLTSEDLYGCYTQSYLLGQEERFQCDVVNIDRDSGSITLLFSPIDISYVYVNFTLDGCDSAPSVKLEESIDTEIIFDNCDFGTGAEFNSSFTVRLQDLSRSTYINYVSTPLD